MIKPNRQAQFSGPTLPTAIAMSYLDDHVSGFQVAMVSDPARAAVIVAHCASAARAAWDQLARTKADWTRANFKKYQNLE